MAALTISMSKFACRATRQGLTGLIESRRSTYMYRLHSSGVNGGSCVTHCPSCSA